MVLSLIPSSSIICYTAGSSKLLCGCVGESTADRRWRVDDVERLVAIPPPVGQEMDTPEKRTQLTSFQCSTSRLTRLIPPDICKTNLHCRQRVPTEGEAHIPVPHHNMREPSKVYNSYTRTLAAPPLFWASSPRYRTPMTSASAWRPLQMWRRRASLPPPVTGSRLSSLWVGIRPRGWVVGSRVLM